MAARTPQNITSNYYGSVWIKFSWEDNTALTGSAPQGFYLWRDDTSVTTPTWTVPPAVDVGLRGGDGASPIQHYTIMLDNTTSTPCWWETFEEYSVGVHAVLDKGGNMWNGGWGTVNSTLLDKGYGDDFESYSVGIQTEPMDGGTGWDGPWGNV